MPAGQPTLYREEYCEQIETHMKQGFSASSFGGVVGVSMESISEWKRIHPQFSEAIKRGQASRVWYWEGRLIKSDKNDALPIIFALKNVHPTDWRDRRDIELTGANGAPLFDAGLVLAAAELARRRDSGQIVDVQEVEPKLIVDQTVNKEEK